MKTIAACFGISLFLMAGPASAQDAVGTEANGIRGAFGLGLLGYELTLTIEAAAGVKNPYLLYLLPLIVAGGGAAGGYFMEASDYGNSPEAGVGTLAAGLTLLVPSILLSLVLSAEEYEVNEGAGVPASGTPPPETVALPAPPPRATPSPSLLALKDGNLNLGLPSVALGDAPIASLYRPGERTDGFTAELALFGWIF